MEDLVDSVLVLFIVVTEISSILRLISNLFILVAPVIFIVWVIVSGIVQDVKLVFFEGVKKIILKVIYF